MKAWQHLGMGILVLSLSACQAGLSAGGSLNPSPVSGSGQLAVPILLPPSGDGLGPRSTGPSTQLGPKSTGPKTRSTSEMLQLFQTLDVQTYPAQEKLTTQIQVNPPSDNTQQLKALYFAIEIRLNDGTEQRIFSAPLDQNGVYEYSQADLQLIQHVLHEMGEGEISDLWFVFFDVQEASQQTPVTPLLETRPLEDNDDHHLNFDVPDQDRDKFYEAQEGPHEEASEGSHAEAQESTSETQSESSQETPDGDSDTAADGVSSQSESADSGTLSTESDSETKHSETSHSEEIQSEHQEHHREESQDRQSHSESDSETSHEEL